MATFRRKTWKDKNGKIKSSWQVDYYEEGVRVRKSGFKTKVKAEQYLKLETNTTLTRKTADKTLFFDEVARNFLKFHAEIHCKKNTIQAYKTIINRHLIPFFGHQKAYNIKPEHINEYIRYKLTKRLSNNTINYQLTLLHNVLQRLIENGKLENNPVSNVKRLKTTSEEMKFYTPDEVMRLLDTCKLHYKDFYPLLFTAIFSGARKGEILALTWDDINLRLGKININKTYSGGVISPPKTPNSNRKVDLTETNIAILKEYKLKSKPNKHNLVFSNKAGKYIDADNIVKRRFEPCIRKAGLNYIRFHDLRHTYASMLIAQNIPIKYVQAQLGHSSIQTTLDRYAHIMPEINIKAVNVLEKYLKNDPDEENNSIIEIKQKLNS